MKKKVVTLSLVVALIATAAIGGTMAYFTDNTEVATNTFTVGDVQIKLDETDVDIYGEKDGQTRVIENEYKLIPGHEYTKDPMVTVEADSEEAYVRMFVKIDAAAKTVFGDSFLPQNYVREWDPAIWETTKVVTPVKDQDGNVVAYQYEFRYYKTVNTLDRTDDLALEPLFKEFFIPDTLSHEDIAALEGLQVEVKAQAIQADGFDDNADAAFAALPPITW